MSVINRVLVQLERRGVYIEREQDMVRAVPPPRSRRMSLLLAALLLSLAVWWWQERGVSDGSKQQPVAFSVAPALPGPASGAVATEFVASSSGVPVAIPVVSVVPATPQPASRPSLQAAAPKPAPQPAALPRTAASVPLNPPVLAMQDKAKPHAAALPAAPKVAADAPSKTAATQDKPTVRPPDTALPASKAARPKPHPDKLATEAPAATEGMPMKQISRGQQADAEFRKGGELAQQGRSAEAIASYQAALQLDGTHDAARQALAALLLEDKRRDEVERLLQERLAGRPEHTGFAMLLARLQVERGATGEALVTLERSLPHAEAKADYQAFLAALQQRNNLHADAITHYQAALQLQPGNGAWLMGYGISLQALRRTEEAKAAYRQALESKNLSPDLKAFVQRKLNGL